MRILCLLALVGSTYAWFLDSKSPSSKRAIPNNVKLVVLPGFGNNSNDYFLPEAPQGSLVRSLQNRGWRDDQIRVLPMERLDWLQVFVNGLFDLRFWTSNMAATCPSFRWYLKCVAGEIAEVCEESSDTKVVLVCHSAGGWLARAALGYFSQAQADEQDVPRIELERVLGMVTLGAPHIPPPPEVMDMTRGALRITNEDFPGAYHIDDGLFYITVVGNAIAGIKDQRRSPFERTTPTGLAFNSYEAVCGAGTSMGDGLIPRMSAHLDDAIQINLDGVFHSINAPDKWYGSDSLLDRWHDTMLEQIYSSRNMSVRTPNRDFGNVVSR
jgi:pimeloyl-ACP methyl ester carboxylesterase